MNTLEQLEILERYATSWRPTGRILPKDEVCQGGYWHLTAHLWIINPDGLVLLQHRSPGKDILPDVDDVAVAGHVSAGMNAQQTVIKEGVEELGLKLKMNDFELAADTEQLSTTHCELAIPGWPLPHRSLDVNFVACLHIGPSTSLRLEPGKVQSVRWVPIDALEVAWADPALRRRFATRPPEDAKLKTMALSGMRRVAGL